MEGRWEHLTPAEKRFLGLSWDVIIGKLETILAKTEGGCNAKEDEIEKEQNTKPTMPELS